LWRYRLGGWDALDAGKLSRRWSTLDASAMQRVYESVVATDPRQFRVEFPLGINR